MTERLSPGDFSRKVMDLFTSGVIGSQTEALLYAVQHRQIEEIRNRMSILLDNPNTDQVNNFIKSLFTKESKVSESDLLFITAGIGSSKIKKILNTLANINDIKSLELAKVEKFIIEANVILPRKSWHHKKGYPVSSEVFIDKNPHLVYPFIADTCVTMDLSKLATIAISLARHVSKEAPFIDSNIPLHNIIIKYLESSAFDDKLNTDSDRRYLEALTCIMAKISSSNEVNDDMLISIFRKSLEIDRQIPDTPSFTLVNKYIDANGAALLKRVNNVLYNKSIDAMKLFGNRRLKSDVPSITGQMESATIDIAQSTLDLVTKTSLCTQIAKVILEARVSEMTPIAVDRILREGAHHIDFEVLVKSLNKRGKDNLMECGSERDRFVHLLDKKARGKVFEMDLGL